MTPAASRTDMPGQKLGLAMCIALVMGNMIGSGVFLLPAALAPLGWNAVIGWGVTIGGTLCLALVLARLARLLPGGTGPFTYAAEAFGPGVGFIVAWSFWISCWTANAALAVAATSNLSILFPAFAAEGRTPALLAIGFIWFFTAINLLGVRKAGGAQLLTVALKLLPLVGAVGVAAWVLGTGSVTPPTLADAAPVNLTNIGSAATLTLFALLGFESALAVGERVRDPERTVPRATMIGAVATGVIYLLSCTAVTMLLPVATVQASNAPYATFFSALVSPGAGQFVALFAAIAALGALNGFILLTGEMPRDLAQKAMLPARLAAVNRFGAPVWSLLLASALASLVVYANYSRGLAGLFNFMVLVTTSTAIIFYMAAALAAYKFERQKRIAASPGFMALTVIGFVYGGWAFYGAGIEASLWSLAMTATGFPIYLVTRARHPNRCHFVSHCHLPKIIADVAAGQLKGGNAMNWMLMPLKRYADFSGRSCRTEYWMFTLFQFIVVLVPLILFFALADASSMDSGGGGFPTGLLILLLIYLAVFLVPSIAVTVRRFHDQDKSGWFYLLSFIPYVGGIVIFVFMCLEGTKGPNQYGDDPLGRGAQDIFG